MIVKKSVFSMAAAAALGLSAGVVNADPVSFTASGNILVLGPGDFDFVAFRVISSTDPTQPLGFVDPGFVADSATPTWSQVYTSSGDVFDTLGIERVGGGTSVQFFGDLSFAGDSSVGRLLEAVVFRGDERLGFLTGSYNASSGPFGGGPAWSFFGAPTATSGSGWDPDRSSFGDSVVIPLPSSAALAFVGLGACCVRRRRAV